MPRLRERLDCAPLEQRAAELQVHSPGCRQGPAPSPPPPCRDAVTPACLPACLLGACLTGRHAWTRWRWRVQRRRGGWRSWRIKRGRRTRRPGSPRSRSRRCSWPRWWAHCRRVAVSVWTADRRAEGRLRCCCPSSCCGVRWAMGVRAGAGGGGAARAGHAAGTVGGHGGLVGAALRLAPSHSASQCGAAERGTFLCVSLLLRVCRLAKLKHESSQGGGAAGPSPPGTGAGRMWHT